MWPLVDNRNPFEVLIPKLKAAAEKFDMVPQPQHPQFGPQPWDVKSDNALPGSPTPYFLQANRGPKYLVEGVVVKPLATTKESDGKFAIGSIEGSSWHTNSTFKSKLRFQDVHHAVQVTEGQLSITIDGQKTLLQAGETVYLPKQSVFNISFASRFAKAYVFASGAGLIELLCELGSDYQHNIVPENAGDARTKNLTEVSTRYSCSVTEV